MNAAADYAISAPATRRLWVPATACGLLTARCNGPPPAAAFPLALPLFAGALLASGLTSTFRRQNDQQTTLRAPSHGHRNRGGAEARSCPGPPFARSTGWCAQAEPGSQRETSSPVRMGRDDRHQ